MFHFKVAGKRKVMLNTGYSSAHNDRSTQIPSRNYAFGGNIEQVFNELMFCSLTVTV